MLSTDRIGCPRDAKKSACSGARTARRGSQRYHLFECSRHGGFDEGREPAAASFSSRGTAAVASRGRVCRREYGHGRHEGGARDCVGGGDPTPAAANVCATRPIHHHGCAPCLWSLLTVDTTTTTPRGGAAAASVTPRPPMSPPKTLGARCATECHGAKHQMHPVARTGSYLDRAQPSMDRSLIRVSTYGSARD